jgi:hypothetical protein
MGKLLKNKRAIKGKGEARGAIIHGEVHGRGHREGNTDRRWERKRGSSSQ